MKQYTQYYLVLGSEMVAGPFISIDAAVHGKQKFVAPLVPLLKIVKSAILAEDVN